MKKLCLSIVFTFSTLLIFAQTNQGPDFAEWSLSGATSPNSDVGLVRHYTPSFSSFNVFGMHTVNDATPTVIGGNHTYFVDQNFQGSFSDENNNRVQGPYSKVFVPGQLRIGTMNTSWNNFKMKIVTDPINAPFINGMDIDHTNPNGWSYALRINVNNDNTRAIAIRNNSLTGQPNDYVFRVDGSGHVFCPELIVMQAGNFPDYVFSPDYKLKSLNEVSEFIKENGHLPNVPSAKEVEEEGGFEVGEMQKVLLEKVEELTLYVIQLEEKINHLQLDRNEAKCDEISDKK